MKGDKGIEGIQGDDGPAGVHGFDFDFLHNNAKVL